MTAEYYADPAQFNAALVEEFRANDGRLSGMFEKSFMLLLTTTGAQTGQARTVPLGHWTVDGALVVVASGNGSPQVPGWFHNVAANPEVEVEIATPDGVDAFAARARVAGADERARLWPLLLEQAPFFADHQDRIEREIPIVILDRT